MEMAYTAIHKQLTTARIGATLAASHQPARRMNHAYVGYCPPAGCLIRALLSFDMM
jgi:hypothetical protein